MYTIDIIKAVPEVRHSVCALDCPDCCGLLLNVDENGRASKLRGDPEHPVTQGFLCGKVARYLDREYSPERLLYPLRRTGPKGSGQFTRIGWDQALDEIGANLSRVAAESGPEAILPYSYAGTMGLLQGSSMDRRFFHRLGASRLDRTICSSAGGAGLTDALGYRYGTEPEQFRNAKLIIAWGANVLATNVHLWPFIVDARRRGAKFYVIDPVAHKTALTADRHYPVYPGSDLALALGLMHVILRDGLEDRAYIERHTSGIEELRSKAAQYTPQRVAEFTGIPAADLVALAHEYAGTQPAVIRLNYGVQRSERGASAVHAVACLPALTGAWKHPGGGFQLSTSQAFAFDRRALERPDLQHAALGREARLINMSELGKALVDLDQPRVKALVVYNSNPAAIAPNQHKVLAGLRREDLFTVAIEQVQTDTADYADIVLPATTMLEHTDLYFAYGHYYVQLARPALAEPGECRSNVQIFREFAQRMGFTDSCFSDTEDDMIRQALASGHRFLEGITLERLDREHFVRLNLSEPGTPFLPFADGGFGTPSGRCDLGGIPEYEPPVESRLGDARLRQQYPLELISSKNHDSLNSTFGVRDDVDAQTAVLEMHVEDAKPRGIEDGQPVRVYNQRGSVVLRACVNGGVREGVVRAPSVRWNKRAPGGYGINVLTSDRLTDRGGGPVFYSCLVQVERCGD